MNLMTFPVSDRAPLVSKKKVAPRNPAKPPPTKKIQATIISEFTEEEPSYVHTLPLLPFLA